MPLVDPPQTDEVEVSVFGPGKGEAVLVHLGDDDWIVVDSCIHRDTRENAILRYLRDLDVDPHSVRLVVPTHAHDDHISGISSIIKWCEHADVIVPIETTGEEFFSLLEQDVHFDELRHSVYREFREIHSIIEERRALNPGYSYKWAIENLVLWSRPGSGGVPPASCVVLSPSNRAVELTKARWAEAFASAGEDPAMPQVDPNTVAVALWIEVGPLHILLGSDLEMGPAGCGWLRVLQLRGGGPKLASVYKVAHHGSVGADHDDIWTRLLTDDPTAVVAPYRPSHLPRPADVARICSHTESAYVTAHPGFQLSSGAARTAAAGFSDVTANIWESDRRAGQVRLRTPWDGTGPWTVTVDPPGKPLCD